MAQSLALAALWAAPAATSAHAQTAGSEQQRSIQRQDDRPQGVWMFNPGTGTIYWCKQIADGPTCVKARMISDEDWVAQYGTSATEASGSSSARARAKR